MEIAVDFIRSRLKILLFLLCLVALFACLRNAGQEVTSTSVTTGNPTGIKVVFKRESVPVSLNGTVDIYAADQIPVEGYSPDPLLRISLNKSQSIEIGSESIDSIEDSLWPVKSVEGDSIKKFNVVVTGDSLGLILEGYGFRKRKGGTGFDFFKNGNVLASGGATIQVAADLVPLTDYVCKTDTNRLAFSSIAVYHLFIYGTGYKAKGEAGVFKLSKLPIGQHNAHLIKLPGRDHLTSGQDSASVFNLIGGLNTANDSIYRGSEHDRVELPDSLKYK
jgi:hypothetical protein